MQMNTVSISRNVHVRDDKGKKLGDGPIIGTFTYNFPESVAEYEELASTNKRWNEGFLVRLANHALLGFVQAQISSGLQKGVFQGTKDATLEISEDTLTSIQAAVTNYAPFQSKRAAPRKASNRTLRDTFEKTGDVASAIAMYNGQLEYFREAVRRDPSKATDPDLVALYADFDATLAKYNLQPLSEELLEIAAAVEGATDV